MTRRILITLALASLCTVGIFGCGDDTSPAGGNGAEKRLRIGMLPKVKGVSYFTSCADGGREAAKELGVDLVYDGPTDGKATSGADLVGQWALQGFDAIAVSAVDGQILGEAMKEAQAKGVKVISWDADVPADSRSFFVNQATPEQIGTTLVDTLAKEIGEEGEVAILSADQTAANQNEWIKFMTARLKSYPRITVVATEYPGEEPDRCLTTAKTLLKAHPNLKGMWAISSNAFPAAAEAVRQEGKSGKVRVTGLGTPKSMKPYVDDGTVGNVVLWNTRDLGYLTIYTAEALASGKLKPGDTSIKAGRLGEREIVDGQVLLGEIVIFTKANIGQFDF